MRYRNSLFSGAIFVYYLRKKWRSEEREEIVEKKILEKIHVSPRSSLLRSLTLARRFSVGGERDVISIEFSSVFIVYSIEQRETQFFITSRIMKQHGWRLDLSFIFFCCNFLGKILRSIVFSLCFPISWWFYLFIITFALLRARMRSWKITQD